MQGNRLYFAELVKNLGKWFDSDVSRLLKFRVSAKGVLFQLRDFRLVRCFLTNAASILVTNALLSSLLNCKLYHNIINNQDHWMCF